MTKPDAASVLAERVHTDAGSKPFAQVTIDEVRARAAELKSAVGWGPTARVAPVAMAWSELARTMDAAGAQTVGELPPEDVSGRAERLWIVPPGGSLLP
ncbi:MAG TPA: hypothetical protein VGI67_06215 [Thermoleophilaceae bacterium]|jgi:hypothetical protein